MIFKRFLYILTIITFFWGIPVFAQDDFVKKSIVLVPMGADDVPSYIPMIVERLLAAKIDSSDAYFVFDREIFDNILKEASITLPQKIDDETALKIGKELEINHVLYGIISQKGTDYVIKTRVMDVETGVVVSEDTQRASDIKGLETAVGKLTRSIVSTLLPEEIVAEAVETLDKAEKIGDEAAIEESVTAFEELVEENPKEALALVGEPAREAIKDTIREEVVDEEIQLLYDKEKADKKRKWQFWSIIGIESIVQFGNVFGITAADLRFESVMNWNNYMNNIFTGEDPYWGYRDDLENSEPTQLLNYLFTGGGNFALAYYYYTIPEDLFTFSKIGRQVFVISNILNISGYASQTASVQLGFYAQRKYFDYMNATSDFTDKYEEYRSAYILPLIAGYTRTGLWTLGMAGMVTAALLPGEKTPMILSERSRKYLTWGQSLISVGNFTSGIANNLRATAEEAWISDNSPSGTVGDSSYLSSYISSQVFYYSTYAIYIGGAVLTYLGLTSEGSENGDENKADDSSLSNFSLNILPAYNGITAVARLRLD
ncbi:MAG: hypothetical protein KAH95_15700 [Spirochaetales bacterium]|nr:hypothetical protein [Spirochaetales bacterium]